MKRWILIAVSILAVIAIVVFLKWKWQSITMLLAAAAAPFKLLFGSFKSRKQEIQEKFAGIRQKEKQYQAELNQQIAHKEGNIRDLEAHIADLDEQIVMLDQKRARVHKEIEEMTLDELQAVGRHYFGD